LNPFTWMYDKNRFVRQVARKLGFGYVDYSELRSSRSIEYPWVLRNLNLPTGVRVLDVGSTGSIFPIVLNSFGYQVYVIDVREYEWKTPPGVVVIVEDIRSTQFRSGFFDAVTAISTIEHIGLGRFGDQLDESGDRSAIIEMTRVLKKGGELLMTVPFGRGTVTPMHRVYDSKALDFLVEGLSVEKMEFYGLVDNSWTPFPRSKLEDLDSSKGEKAIACVKAFKP